MNYKALLKRKIENNRTALLTVAIIIVGGLALKLIADSQSRIDF